MIVRKLQQYIHKALRNMKIDLEPQDIVIEIPNNPEYGDYATNVAMRVAKIARKAPPLIAKDIVSELNKDKKILEHFSFSVLQGFMNVRLNDGYLIELILEHIDADLGKSDLGKDKKVLLEFVSANPTGPLHIGHGRWAALGDVLARVLKHVGYKVSKEFYINDQGKQIENLYRSIEAVRAGKAVPEDGYHGHYVKDLAGQKEDPLKLLLKEQKKVLKEMDVEFDTWFSEKELHAKGSVRKAIKLLKEKGALEEKDGAVWFKSTLYGDDKDRVLVRENGEPTYFASDIAYHEHKLERGFDQLINIWGADHHGYIARVQAALKALSGDNDFNKLKVILGQLVSLYRGGEPVKMSKRTGDMITLQEVIEEIGVDATRYFLVSRSADTALDFDLELAKKKSDENPVYYVQYAHARISSILRQKEAMSLSKPLPTPLSALRKRGSSAIGSKVSGSIIRDKLEPLERQLVLMLARIPDELELVALTCGVHRLTALAQELAAIFHRFYHEYRVLSDNKEDTLWRLALVRAIQQALRVIFELLGVSAPEKM
jgi:arginyl-tRNA synthetase